MRCFVVREEEEPYVYPSSSIYQTYFMGVGRLKEILSSWVIKCWFAQVHKTPGSIPSTP